LWADYLFYQDFKRQMEGFQTNDERTNDNATNTQTGGQPWLYPYRDHGSHGYSRVVGGHSGAKHYGPK
jgi:hypothetical protein